MDNYIVSARKYRPAAFESVVGQSALTETLRNAIRSGKLAHAYLFCGPRGVGKTTCARIFAKTINCLTPTDTHDACNECESCVAFNEGRSMNIHELDAASNNSVDDIRQLIEEVRIPPQVGKYKVFIIDEVHMLSAAAFNAFLKTLEEPPAYAVFILATTEKHKVLPTILSRCQVFDFARITIADTVRHLQYVAQKEGIQVTEEALNVVAQKADGGMRDALSIFDQLVTFCGENITYEQTINSLNVLDSDYYFRLTEDLLAGKIPDSLVLFDEVLRKGFDAGHFVSGFASHLRDLMVSKDPQTVVLLETSDAVRKHYAEQAARCSAPWLLQMLDIIGTCDINYRTARNKRLTVELALMKCCSAASAPGAAGTAIKAAPVAPAASATATPVKPAVASTTSVPSAPSASRPAAPAAPAAPSAPARPAPAAAPAAPSTPAAPARPAPAAPAAPAAPPQNRPFTVEQLEAAWNSLRQIYPDDMRFLSMLNLLTPRILTMPECELVMMNNSQMRELQQKLPKILATLRAKLQNDHLQLALRVEEGKFENVACSPKERFELLAKENPDIIEMAKSLDLRFN